MKRRVLDPSLQFIPTDIVQKNSLSSRTSSLRLPFNELSCLGLQFLVGCKFHLKLNIGGRPIANKYSTLAIYRPVRMKTKLVCISRVDCKFQFPSQQLPNLENPLIPAQRNTSFDTSVRRTEAFLYRLIFAQ